jgi:putative inorganic carbon (hco3(-)) transporter
MALEVSDAALDHLGAAGFDPVYGARPLKRAIRSQLENPLAQALLGLALPRHRNRGLAMSASFDYRIKVLALVALFGGILSSVLATNPAIALQEVALFVLIFWTSVLAGHEVSDGQFLKALGLFSLAIVIYWIRFVFEAWSILPIEGVKMSFALTGYGNFRFMNQVQSWVLPLMLFFWLKPAEISNRLLLWFGRVASVLYASLVFAAGGRGILLAFLGTAAAAALLLGPQGRRAVRVLAVLGVLGVAVYAATIQVPYFIYHQQLDTYNVVSRFEEGAGVRMLLWTVAANAALDSPIVGIGPQHFILISPEAAHPHNSFLQFTSEWGVMAGSALMLLLVSLGLLSWIQARSRGISSPIANDQQIVLAMGVSTGLLYSMVSGVFVMPYSQIAFVLVAALVLGRRTATIVHPAELVARNSLERVVTIGIVVCAGVVLAYTTINEVPAHLEWEFTQEERTFPRFWAEGFWNKNLSGPASGS